MMGFLRHRRSIKSTSLLCCWLRARLLSIPPSLIHLISLGWLFLGRLLPSRACLRFTSYENSVSFRRSAQNDPTKRKTFRLDFYMRQRITVRLDFYVRQWVRNRLGGGRVLTYLGGV